MKKATLYGLSGCSRSQLFQKALNDLPLEITYVEVDTLPMGERQNLVEEISKQQLPTLLWQEEWYSEQKLGKIRKKIGEIAEADQLFQRFETLARRKGFRISEERSLVYDLLIALLHNRDRYGYMACPCRLASGIRKEDLDIICPCKYRADDINEYGRCYCGLFTQEETKKRWRDVPDRR